MGPSGWIGGWLDGWNARREEAGELLRDAYCRTAPKRLSGLLPPP
jgi:hypothetical protein